MKTVSLDGIPREQLAKVPEAKFIEVTPEMAEAWLAKNSMNRPLSRWWVEKLKDNYRRGEWVCNGESLIISRDGALLDGQHRLTMIKELGVKVRQLVVEGMDPAVFYTLGQFKSRKGQDVLAIAGFQNRYVLRAAITGVVMAVRNTTKPDLSNYQVLEMMELHPGLNDAVTLLCDLRMALGGSHAAALYYLFSKVDAVAAAKFFDDLRNGTGLTLGDPVYHLREKLGQLRGRKERLEAHMGMSMAIRAFNNRRKGVKVTRVSRYGTLETANDIARIDGLDYRTIKMPEGI